MRLTLYNKVVYQDLGCKQILGKEVLHATGVPASGDWRELPALNTVNKKFNYIVQLTFILSCVVI